MFAQVTSRRTSKWQLKKTRNETYLQLYHCVSFLQTPSMFKPKWLFWSFFVSPNDIFDMNKNIMLVLRPHGRGRMFSRDRASIGNPRLNIGFPTHNANCATIDRMEITLGPSIQHIPLGFYHTGGFNAMWNISLLCRRGKDNARYRLWQFHVSNLQCVSSFHVRETCSHLWGKSF